MILTFTVNSFAVALAVLIHYEFVHQFSLRIPEMHMNHRYRILIGIFGALIVHSIEIWIFAVFYYFMHKSPGWGTLTGNFDGSIFDCAYFSFTTFTTLGFGDIAPIGNIRFLVGIESLTGLVLITWTASFLFLEMQRYWGTRQIIKRD
jgi:hypothetical protein